MCEKIHGIPDGYTDTGLSTRGGQLTHVRIADRTRLRIVANSWHLGVTAHVIRSYLDGLRRRRLHGWNRTLSDLSVSRRRRTDGWTRFVASDSPLVDGAHSSVPTRELTSAGACNDDDSDGQHRRSSTGIGDEFRLTPHIPVELDGRGHSWIERLANEAAASVGSYAVNELPDANHDRHVLVDCDPHLHAAMALSTVHPMRRRWTMDSSLQFVFACWLK